MCAVVHGSIERDLAVLHFDGDFARIDVLPGHTGARRCLPFMRSSDRCQPLETALLAHSTTHLAFAVATLCAALVAAALTEDLPGPASRALPDEPWPDDS
jgi:hypothetical protein